MWHLQFLEDVLANYLTARLRISRPATMDDVHVALARERRKTLGAMLREARGAGMIREQIAAEFDALLEDRNWLVHRAMEEYGDAIYTASGRDAFLQRAAALRDRAINLKKALYIDLRAWFSQQGVDVEWAEARGVENFRSLSGRE